MDRPAMKARVADLAIKMARAQPALAKAGISIAGRLYPPRRRPVLLRKFIAGLATVAVGINYRATTNTRLPNGMKIRVVWVEGIGWGMCVHDDWEPETTSTITNFLKPGMAFADVGAYVGQYTLLAAGLGATVHAFEADPQTYDLLAHNVATNMLRNVRVNHSAVSDQCGFATFYRGPADRMWGGSLKPLEERATPASVPTVTLDAYAAQQGIGRIDLMKIDVEGAELQALRGARGILSTKPRPTMVIEFCEKNQRAYGSTRTKLAEYLYAEGFELLRITPEGLRPYEPRADDDFNFNVLAQPRG